MKASVRLTRPIAKALKKDLRAVRKYNNIYKGVISACDYYRLSKSGLLQLKGDSFTTECLKVIRVYIGDATEREISYLMIKHGKIELSIIIVKIGAADKKDSLSILNSLKLDILEARLVNQCGLRSFGGSTLDILRGESVKLDFKVPVCPDYSYKTGSSGKSVYDFKSLNSGIGLVALQAINKVNEISAAANSLIDKNFTVSFLMLLGDFEATDNNCIRLGETKESFEDKLLQSCNAIKNLHPIINTALFSDLLGGIEAWDNLLEMVSRLFRINEYDDLGKSFSGIKHKKKLISRLPLYNRWYGKGADIKKVFFEQVVQYITMGVTLRLCNKSCILLACDHNAMHSYYVCNENMIAYNMGAEY